MNLAYVFCFLFMSLSCSHALLKDWEKDLDLYSSLWDDLDVNSCGNFNCKYGGDIRIDYDEYVSIRKLGDGASGKTCLAKNIDTGEYKAIKILNPYQNIYASAHEARMHFELQDVKEVAQVETWAKAKGCGLIVMEYIENSGFPSDIRHAWKQMLLAFEKIHNKGILHLDIDTVNVLWDKNGTIKVIDFGYATHLQSINQTDLCGNPGRPTQKFFSKFSPEYIKKCELDELEWSTTKKSADLKEDLEEGKIDISDQVRRKHLDGYDLRYQIYDLEFENFKISKNRGMGKICPNLTHKLIEMLVKYQEVGTPSDVWSMCSVLFELMYGKEPYEYVLLHDDRYDVLRGKQNLNFKNKIKKLIDSKTSLTFPPYEDKVLRDTVMRCLVREPNQRPTIKEMLEMLEKAPLPVKSRLKTNTSPPKTKSSSKNIEL